jgi:hypothetical protein
MNRFRIDDRPRDRSQILFLRHVRSLSQVVHTPFDSGRAETSSSSPDTQAQMRRRVVPPPAAVSCSIATSIPPVEHV